MKPIDPTGLAIGAYHPLIGKEYDTFVANNRIIGSFKPFAVVARGERFKFSSLGIALLEVGVMMVREIGFHAIPLCPLLYSMPKDHSVVNGLIEKMRP